MAIVGVESAFGDGGVESFDHVVDIGVALGGKDQPDYPFGDAVGLRAAGLVVDDAHDAIDKRPRLLVVVPFGHDEGSDRAGFQDS